jgi:hypothetical protein
VDVLMTAVVLIAMSSGLGCAIGWGMARLLLGLLMVRSLQPAVARAPSADRALLARQAAFNTPAADLEREIPPC